MKPHFEIEYKTLITENQWQLLVKAFPEAQQIEQTNIYFDATPSLQNQGIACRIRQIEDTFLFTLKVKDPSHPGIEEIEFPLPSCSLSNPKVQALFESRALPPLQEIGRLHTTRYLVDLEKGFLCIDKNTYNHHLDFEVEYELKDGFTEDQAFFVDLLKSFGIPYQPNHQSKIQRCKATL